MLLKRKYEGNLISYDNKSDEPYSKLYYKLYNELEITHMLGNDMTHGRGVVVSLILDKKVDSFYEFADRRQGLSTYGWRKNKYFLNNLENIYTFNRELMKKDMEELLKNIQNN